MNKNTPTQSKIRLLKVPEVANLLGISRALAYNLVRTGELRSVHIRSARRIRKEDLNEYIKSNLTARA